MIIVKNRELLIPGPERYIGTTYDTESENRQFLLSRFAQNGVDLSALTFHLDLKYANDAHDTVLLDKEVTDTNIILTWYIGSSVLQVPGTLFIQIRAADDEVTVKWSSFHAALYVERHLNTPGNYGGSLTEIEQIEQDHQYMKGVVNELKSHLDYTHEAEAWAIGKKDGEDVPSTDETYHNNSKYYSEQANTKATQAANSATAAANSATQAAETVSDTNTRFNNAVAAVTSETEVIDARVGADGTQYTVLKNRLDAEHNQLKNALDVIFKYIVGEGNLVREFTLTEGAYISATGAIVEAENFAYTDYIPVEPDNYIIITDRTRGVNYTTRVHGYDASMQWVSLLYSDNDTAVGKHFGEFDCSGISYIRVSYQTQYIEPIIICKKATIAERIDAIYAIATESKDQIVKVTKSFPNYCKDTVLYDPHYEQGALSNVDGSETSSTSRIRTGFIPVGLGIIAVNNGTDSCWVRGYSSDVVSSFIGNYSADASGNLISNTSATENNIIIDSIADLGLGVNYVRIVEKKTSGSITPEESTYTYTGRFALNGNPLDDVYVSKIKKPYSANDISVAYDIDNDGHYTKGFLKLPSSYTPGGTPTPLIVFVHGSADFTNINAPAMTTMYNDYYNYMRDCGYAIFDCYAYGSQYPGYASQTWGIPLNDKCYLSGIKYVCDKYNIDPRNIFVCCKSLGGLQAFNMLLNPAYNIKAVAMLAPELWELGMKFGYTSVARHIVADDLGFSEDTNHVLDFEQGDAIPEGFYDYVTENTAKWCGVFPNYRGLQIANAIKPDYYRNAPGTSSMIKASLTRPVKIWIAPDDESVSYGTASAVIESLQNGGCKAELRTMPENTGGHHSVDNSVNAPQTTNITTRLGITYATIPTAYYEVVEFFDRYYTH